MTTLESWPGKPEEAQREVLCWGCGQSDHGVVCGPCIAVVSEALTIIQNIMGGYIDNAR